MHSQESCRRSQFRRLDSTVFYSINFLTFFIVSKLFFQTSEKQMLIREIGEEKAEVRGQDASDQIIYKIDVPANR